MEKYKIEKAANCPGVSTACVRVNGRYIPFGSRYELRVRLRAKFPKLSEAENRELANECERAVRPTGD